MTARYTQKSPAQLKCPVCNGVLEARFARGRKSGKPFLMLICPQDGRHIRCFITDQAYVGDIVSRMEAKS